MDKTLNELKRIITSNEETSSKYYAIKRSVNEIASDHVFILDYTKEPSNFAQNFFMVLFLLILQIASFILLNNSLGKLYFILKFESFFPKIKPWKVNLYQMLPVLYCYWCIFASLCSRSDRKNLQLSIQLQILSRILFRRQTKKRKCKIEWFSYENFMHHHKFLLVGFNKHVLKNYLIERFST